MKISAVVTATALAQTQSSRHPVAAQVGAM
jgi:hypothetical protein